MPSQKHHVTQSCAKRLAYSQLPSQYEWPGYATGLIPRCGGGGERAPGTHCLRMRLIAMEVCGDRVCTYTGDDINSLRWCASSYAVGVLSKWIVYRAVQCLPVAGYLEIQLKTEQVASNECRLPRKHAFLRLSTNFGKSIPTTAYQTFLFVPSIKLGRAFSSNVYSVLRTKADVTFMTVYAIHVNRSVKAPSWDTARPMN